MEQFQRTIRLIGEEAFSALQNSRVAIYGIGGVGSFAANSLCRAGVGSFYLVDKDVVDVTNINRQSIAWMDTVGRDKVDVMKEDMLRINPKANIQTEKAMIRPENLREFLPEHIDYVLDCIDNITSKVFLAKICYNKSIPILSCMGAGNRTDANFIITDVFKTKGDPLAKAMRKLLREAEVEHLDVVWSDLPPREIGDGDRTPASISFIPSMAGLRMAQYVTDKLIEKKAEGKQMVYLDNGNFESEVLKSDKPVLVDFFATWCGPCKMVSPLLEQVSDEMGDKVKVCKLDIDQNNELASKYGVMSIPTFVMFKGGKEVAKNVGAMPKQGIEDFVNGNL